MESASDSTATIRIVSKSQPGQRPHLGTAARRRPQRGRRRRIRRHERVAGGRYRARHGAHRPALQEAGMLRVGDRTGARRHAHASASSATTTGKAGTTNATSRRKSIARAAGRLAHPGADAGPRHPVARRAADPRHARAHPPRRQPHARRRQRLWRHELRLLERRPGRDLADRRLHHHALGWHAGVVASTKRRPSNWPTGGVLVNSRNYQTRTPGAAASGHAWALRRDRRPHRLCARPVTIPR